MSDWQTIGTAPKDGSAILLWNKEWDCPVIASWNDEYAEHYWEPSEGLVSDVVGAIEDATHWLPFLPPPNDS